MPRESLLYFFGEPEELPARQQPTQSGRRVFAVTFSFSGLEPAAQFEIDHFVEFVPDKLSKKISWLSVLLANCLLDTCFENASVWEQATEISFPAIPTPSILTNQPD
jgi:hypothetical protein